LLHDGKYTSLKGDDDVLTIGINRAVTVIAEKKAPGSSSMTPLKVLGDHPDGGKIALYSGKYGPYVKHGKINASLPKGVEAQAYTLDEAIALLTEKGGSKKKSFSPKKKAAAEPKEPKKAVPKKKKVAQ
jgi:DNA topoisomerase-1